MIRLEQTMRAWGSSGFVGALQRELAQYTAQLPLQQALSGSSSVAETPITVVVSHVAETDGVIRVKAGIFYEGLLGGCSCADDPTPNNATTEHCELLLEIDRTTAATVVTLLPDQV